jgi:hypothetical protein
MSKTEQDGENKEFEAACVGRAAAIPCRRQDGCEVERETP